MESQNSSSHRGSLATPLLQLHQSYGAKMVDFAGYFMPIQYAGIVAEHLHTRQHCSLFDVSHMGQAWVVGDSFEEVALALQSVLPANLLKLPEGKMCYSTLLNSKGGIIDDLIVTRLAKEDKNVASNGRCAYFHVVVNASRKAVDYAYFAEIFSDFSGNVSLQTLDNAALVALQGPDSIGVLKALNPEAEKMGFMTAKHMILNGIKCWVSRSGYTGEAGFEIATAEENISLLCEKLLADDSVKMAGLGARDSLRLEAGLPLYGNDMDESYTPVEANLNFVLNKERLASAEFAGAEVIDKQLSSGAGRLRVGLDIEGKAPIRQGVKIMCKQQEVGVVTSGCFSPTLQKPIAFAVINSEFLQSDDLVAIVRNKSVVVKVGQLVFVPTRYK